MCAEQVADKLRASGIYVSNDAVSVGLSMLRRAGVVTAHRRYCVHCSLKRWIYNPDPNAPEKPPRGFTAAKRTDWEKREALLLLAGYSEQLSERELRIAGLYYHDEMTLEEIGHREGVSRERVRQIIQKGLSRARIFRYSTREPRD